MPEKYLGHNAGFWIAVILAAIIQAWARPPSGETAKARAFRRVFGLLCGLFMGVYFSDPVVVWRELDPLVWKTPIGILLAFTGQAIVEFLVELNWSRLVTLLKLWRGGK